MRFEGELMRAERGLGSGEMGAEGGLGSGKVGAEGGLGSGEMGAEGGLGSGEVGAEGGLGSGEMGAEGGLGSGEMGAEGLGSGEMGAEGGLWCGEMGAEGGLESRDDAELENDDRDMPRSSIYSNEDEGTVTKRLKLSEISAMANEPLQAWLDNVPRDDLQHMALLLYTTLPVADPGGVRWVRTNPPCS